ncbi:unnamed protein product [Discula destructiva]
MAAQPAGLPPYINTFGPDGNCTLALCPVEYSVYGYRPSLAANVVFLVLYVISGGIHLYLGLRWKTWFFMGCMLAGALNAVIGYAGRIMMWYNPFTFVGFMMQIVCITCGPVYYTAAIYITLASAINYLSPSLSRFPPRCLYYIFLPCDVVCLALQAAGGALSTTSSGSSQLGVDLALAGLSLQVVGMVVFCGLFGDYLVRYYYHYHLGLTSSDNNNNNKGVMSPGAETRMRVFLGSMAAATVLILVRCAYRVAELHQGYSGALVREEGLFIGLEGVMVVTAVYALMIGHPGLAFQGREARLCLDGNGEKSKMDREAEAS